MILADVQSKVRLGFRSLCLRPTLSPLPSLLPKLPNLMPNPQPRVQPILLPRWQPSLQLESPFLWSLLSMCSSSESNPPTRKSCLLIKLNVHPTRQFLAHFVVHMPLCLHVLFRVAGPLQSKRGLREPSLGVCSLRGARIPSREGNARGRGGLQSYTQRLHPHGICAGCSKSLDMNVVIVSLFCCRCQTDPCLRMSNPTLAKAPPT